MYIHDALDTLSKDPDYKVLTKFRRAQATYSPPPYGGTKKVFRGVYLDTETTGVDTSADEIMELALVPFFFNEDGVLLTVDHSKCDSYLNDSKRDVSDKVRQLTGISAEDISGQTLPLDKIRKTIGNVDLVVAHNAGFDRKFVERVSDVFARAPWACSQNDVPWREKFGAPGLSLEVLAMTQCGVFYDAHRAMIDCQVGVHVLATATDPQGRTAFSYLWENARTETCRLWAVGAGYRYKDLLKARGYRWNGGEDGRFKAWYKDFKPGDVNGENQFLLCDLGVHAHMTTIEAVDRYSVRER